MPITKQASEQPLRDKLLVNKILNAQQRSQNTSREEQQQQWDNFLNQAEITNQEAFLEAIDSDPEKFQQWIKHSPVQQSRFQWMGWKLNLDIDLSAFKTFFTIPRAATAFATVLLFSVITFSLLQPPSPIDQGYTQIIQMMPKEKQWVEPKALDTIDHQSFSFSAQNQQYPHFYAFLTGMEMGKNRLKTQHIDSPANDPDYQAWQELGLWYQLNHYVLQINLTPDSAYWQQQQSVLLQLQKELKSGPSLAAVHQALDQLQQKPNNPRNKVKLQQGMRDYWIALQVSIHVK